ncbi:MAG: molybdopterin molybdotransferase MoeA [Pseudomonadota bacterium]
MATTLRSALRHRSRLVPAKPSAGDCPSDRTMVSVDRALRLLLAEGAARELERVALDRAGGRILALPIVAHCAAPARDASAMDGYAVRDGDLIADWNTLTVIGESFAGHGHTGSLQPGTAVRIFTGAPVPDGADRVILQEEVRHMGSQVLVPRPRAEKRHIRRAGSDFIAGDMLVDARVPLTPARLVAAAAADIAEVAVFARPKVMVVATGDELRAPGVDMRRPDMIPESVSFGVAELARNFGGEVAVHPRLPDDLDRLQGAAAAMLDKADIVVIIGGASVGDRDFSRGMFERAGLRLHFSKVVMRPGKPVWFGKTGGTCILGLPGNPTAAMITARLFLAPLVAAMAGREARTALDWRVRPLAEGLEANGEYECFLGARAGAGAVSASANRDSSAQRALAATEVLIRRRPHAPAAAAGDLVETLEF